MKCKNYSVCCDIAIECPCNIYEECDNYCRNGCPQNITIEDDEGFYHHYCKLNIKEWEKIFYKERIKNE